MSTTAISAVKAPGPIPNAFAATNSADAKAAAAVGAWKPKRTIAECDALLAAPGRVLELTQAMVDGRVLRVYKHLWPSTRAFWLERLHAWWDKEYVVFADKSGGGERYTFGGLHARASRIADIMYTRYGVRKGDRVAILSRNTPDFCAAFWGSQLLGAVSVFVNAWAPPPVLLHCLAKTAPKVLFVDEERAARLLKPFTDVTGVGVGVAAGAGSGGTLLEEIIARTRMRKVFVLSSGSGKSTKPFPGMTPLAKLFHGSTASHANTFDTKASWIHTPEATPDEPATIFFTSGTTGLPKGVLSTQRSFLTNVFNALNASLRALLRDPAGDDAVLDAKPEDIIPGFKIDVEANEVDPTHSGGGTIKGALNVMNGPHGSLGTSAAPADPGANEEAPQKAVLISVPLFHVTGLTSTLMIATALGYKVVFMRKWEKEEAARVIIRERVTNAGGVPSMIMDLLESDLLRELDQDGSGEKKNPLESLACGGAPSAETMPGEVSRKFAGVDAGQGYGLSETNAIVASINGADYVARPLSTGPPTLINDLLIVDPTTERVMPTGKVGELWIRGANIIAGYYDEPEATDKAITRDGWFKSGDLAYVDAEGFLYIRDRIKDIIIRGGENIHSTEVENALYADARILDAAAVSVPDARLGELVAAVVSVKPHYASTRTGNGAERVTEESIIAGVRKLLPSHAVPVMILVQDEMIDRNANGKIVKTELRKRVRAEWARRLKEAKKKGLDGHSATKAKAKL